MKIFKIFIAASLLIFTSVAIAAPPFSDHEARIAELEALVISLQAQVDGNTANVVAIEDLLVGVTRYDDVFDYDTLQFSGMNVQIVNGTGYTQFHNNGTGNLLIGYNELRDESLATDPCPSEDRYCNRRTGSHYLVIGYKNNYSGFYGGMVVGSQNEIAHGGVSISGGYLNFASGSFSSISGGANNTTSGYASSISGGTNNIASDHWTSVSGGTGNIASGYYSSVSGGLWNEASGRWSSVSGGFSGEAAGEYDWVAGSLWEHH